MTRKKEVNNTPKPALQKLENKLSSSISFDQTASEALRLMREVARPDMAFLFLREGERLVLKEVQPPESRQRLGIIPEHRVGECVCGLAVRDGKAMYSRDINTDLRCTWDECKRAGIRSFAALPVARGQEIIGVIGLASLTERDFESQAEFLETLASQVSVSLDNALLYSMAKEELLARRKAEDDLKKSGEKSRLFFQRQIVGMAITSPEKGWLEVNEALCRMLGYTAAELTSMTWAELTYPDDLDADLAQFNRLLAGEINEYNLEKRFVRKDGQVIVTDLSIACVRRDDGTVDYVLAILSDITERNRAEKALRQSEEISRSIIQASPMGIHIYQLEENDRLIFVQANPAADKILGTDHSVFIGKTIEEAFPPLAQTEIPDRYRRAARYGESWENEQVNYDHGGIVGAFEVHAFQLSLGKMAVLFNDISDRKRTEKAVAQSNKLLQTIINTAPIRIFYKDSNLRYMRCNNAFAKDAGVGSPEDLVGKDDYQLAWKEQAELYRTDDLHVLESGIPKLSYDEPQTTPEGNKIWLRTSKVPVLNESNEIIGILGMYEDITERKQTEEKLRKSEERFLLAMKASHDGLFDWNLETNDIYYSPAWKKMLGYEDHELPNDFSVWENTTDPEDVKKSWELQQKLISRQIDRFVLEFQMKHKDGHWVDILSRAEALFNDSGKAVRIIGTHTDITERKRAEAALIASEERLDLAMAVKNEGVWDWNLSTNDTLFDDRYYTMAGYSHGEFPQNFAGWSAHVHPDDLAKADAAIKAYLSGQSEVFDTHFRFRCKDGSWMWIQGRGKIVERDKNGNPLRIIGTHTDISKRKRAEAERDNLQAQLLQAQKLESVGRLAGGVAHDFNNMLTAILGYAQMAKDWESLDRVRKALKVIEESALRSADLVRQLLAFARKQTVAPKILDLNDTVSSMLKMIGRLIGEDIDLSWQPGSNLPLIKMDPTQIDQILANLCINARQAIAGQGKVTIETGKASFDEAYCAVHQGFVPGNYAMLAVSDNGSGMTKEVIEHIFEPFYTTKEVGQGTGLGLATVYGIVSQNNGFINVYSELNEGTTFKIYLPQASEQTLEQKAGTIPESPRGQGEMILIVEDEITVLDLAKSMLEELGYQVLAANTPSEALLKAKAHRDKMKLLISDVVMPEMNGRELAKRIHEFNPGLKCLFTSGYTANVIAHQGVLDEGVNFIQKPFSMQALAAMVHEVLNQK